LAALIDKLERRVGSIHSDDEHVTFGAGNEQEWEEAETEKHQD
jgi:hypothetical protein